MSENEEDMNVEDAHGSESQKESESPDPPRRKKKWYSTNKAKIIVVILIISIALVIGLWGAAPENYTPVEDIVKNSGSYIGEEVQIVGKVGNWSGGQNFTLVGRSDENYTLYVVHTKEIPDGFAIGKDVVVTGKVQNGDTGLMVRSDHSIQVGCPSKY
jgi:cytochrome c-type biogenesis protein CcmE